MYTVKYEIDYESDPKQDDTNIIWRGISEHAKLMRGHEPGKPFAYYIRDEHRQIKGGCSGYIFYGCLYIDLLWIDQSLRRKQYGKRLMENTEKLAKEKKCNFILVNTMDFEALDFYKKLGYFVEFERHGFDMNSIMYFMRKNLVV